MIRSMSISPICTRWTSPDSHELAPTMPKLAGTQSDTFAELQQALTHTMELQDQFKSRERLTEMAKIRLKWEELLAASEKHAVSRKQPSFPPRRMLIISRTLRRALSLWCRYSAKQKNISRP
jgi:hypothetical protein